MLKRYFWLTHVLLVTLAAAFGADIAKSYISAKLATPITSKPTQTRSAPSRQTRAAFADYQVIAMRNIFNANPPSNNEKPEQSLRPAPEPTTPTQLQLKLAGTVAGANNQRYAIIEDLSNRGVQSVHQVGDMIQSAFIVEIRPTCVVLDKDGQPELLCFEYDNNRTAVARRRPSASAPPRPQTDDDDSGIVRVDAATWRVSRELVLEHLTDIAALSRQARVKPYIVQGEQRGFRLTRLQRGSLLHKIGLQNGDVLQKVNGLNITSPEEALRGFTQLRNESTVRLELLRRNQSTTLTYELR